MSVTMQVVVETKFCASHQLHGLEEDHPCARLHGHNYKVWVTFDGTPDEVGMLIDFRVVKDLIKERYDHQHLNDVMPKANTTAENLSLDILRVMNALIFRLEAEGDLSVSRIVVQETDTSSVVLQVKTPTN